MSRFFEAMKNSKIINLFAKAAGNNMESGFRHWLYDPVKTLHGAEIRPGDTVLEVGCGSGFFTVPAARLVGEQGRLVAMDVWPAYVERVAQKTRSANLKNVRVMEGDALDTGLDIASMDAVILFGVIPFPLLPLNRLLPEMHRILKQEGILAVWLWPPMVHFWVPKSILRSGLFIYMNKRNGVYNYKRC
jgi:demethylmenaquinone methyltransferase/2-methoxy-6-polyprenyl-1,4-benzoquinol methylase